MKVLLHLWKKLLCICVILIAIIIIFNEKSATQMIIDKTDEKISSCHREIESLTTQLTVIKKYQKKLDENFIKEKSEMSSEIQELKQTIEALKNENSELKARKCSNISNEIILPVIGEEEKITGNEILQLKAINNQQEMEIKKLQEEIKEQQKNETLLGKHSTIDQRAPEIDNKINEIDPLLHPREEHKGYADGENVHFHRKIPSSADLEFMRDRDGKIKLPQILAPKVLLQKWDEKHRKKGNEEEVGEAGEEKVKNDGREEVLDYQSFKKPNKEENDYKEMGE